MSTPLARPLPVSIFKDDESVIQSHSVLPGAASPLFGQQGIWDFNGVVRRNANLPECGWRATFSNGLTDPEWNLTAREVFMIMANPRHEAVIDAGVHLAAEPFDLQTAIQRVSALRTLVRWADRQGLPARMRTWRDTDLRRFIKGLREDGRKPGTVTNYVNTVKFLHEIAPALALGGPPMDPWQGMSARKAAKHEATNELSTPTVAPTLWFPLVRAAWTYVHTFAPDVLRAMDRYQQLRANARTTVGRGRRTRSLTPGLPIQSAVFRCTIRPTRGPHSGRSMMASTGPCWPCLQDSARPETCSPRRRKRASAAVRRSSPPSVPGTPRSVA